MGRRKIEIKPIKDDRNRSVTFLKRKGGLFKKAYELSELCSVDVAVIIFGQNKRIYEFSSASDVNTILNRYYSSPNPPHEHKTSADYREGKDGDDDDEDGDPGSPRPDSRSPPQQPPMITHPHLQNAYHQQHMGTPSASPPMPNGAFHRHPSPAPPHHPHQISRPGSRAHMRQPSNSLGPPPMPHQHPMQMQPGNDWSYRPNPPIYNPEAAAQMNARPPFSQPPPMNYSQVATHQVQQTSHPVQHPIQHHNPHMYPPQDQRPPMHPNHPQQQHMPQNHTPPQQINVNGHDAKSGQGSPNLSLHASPQPQQAQFHSPPPPQPGKLSIPSDSNKHSSIFTPIEEKSSHLAAHLDLLERTKNPPTMPVGVTGSMAIESPPRSLSLDVGAAVKRNHLNGAVLNGRQPPPAPTSNPPMPQRTSSTPNIPTIQPPSRTNSLQADPKRPKLKVQIPNEPSDDEKTAASPHAGATPVATLTPLRELPLPSPQAERPNSSIPLSAGATGPPNPFARPPPPVTNGVYGSQRSDDTPISALPSRFISEGLLPSPSSYGQWQFDKYDKGDSNFLPSPLPFQTPINTTGPSFRDDDSASKRKISDGSEESQSKRVKV